MLEAIKEITLGSWLTASFVIVIRLIFRRALSARAKYLLWLLVALRLCMPVLPESIMSIQNLSLFEADVPATETLYEAPAETMQQSAEDDVSQTQESHEDHNSYMYESYETSTQSDINKRNSPSPLAAVYLGGVVLCLVVYGEMSLETRRRLRRSVLVNEPETILCFIDLLHALGIRKEIHLCYGEECLIGGLRKPVLLIPRELNGEALKAALTHELMHHKSGDLWIAAFWRLLCCVYWFNPAVWICAHWVRFDCEKACDQRVLEYQVSPAVYAELLLEESRIKQKPCVGTTAFGRGNIKSRIKAVADFKKPAIWMTLTALLAAIVITSCTATGAVTEKPWKWSETLNVEQITEAYILYEESVYSIQDQELSEIVSAIQSSEKEDFTEEINYSMEPYSTLVLKCGNDTYTIHLVYHPEAELEMELDGRRWLLRNSDLAWNIKHEIYENDLSPASLPLSLLLHISQDSEIMAAVGRLIQDGDPEELNLLLSQQIGDYLTEDFLEEFSSFNGLGALWKLAYENNFSVTWEELKVTNSEISETIINYSAKLRITLHDKSQQEISVGGQVYCDDMYHVQSISMYSKELTEFYESFMEQIPVITVAPRQENEEPEITVLPHDEALTPEVSNLPQGEEKPDIQKIG